MTQEQTTPAEPVTEEASPLPMISTCRNCGRPREEHYDRGERGSLVCPGALHMYAAGLTRRDIEIQRDNLDQQYQRLYVENVRARNVLKELLELDDARPVDPTFWRKWWNEARDRAIAVLGSEYLPKKGRAP